MDPACSRRSLITASFSLYNGHMPTWMCKCQVCTCGCWTCTCELGIQLHISLCSWISEHVTPYMQRFPFLTWLLGAPLAFLKMLEFCYIPLQVTLKKIIAEHITQQRHNPYCRELQAYRMSVIPRPGPMFLMFECGPCSSIIIHNHTDETQPGTSKRLLL